MEQGGLTQKMVSDAPEVICEECENNKFVERLTFRKVSKLMIGSDKDQVVPIPVFCCTACGHVNEEFQPKF